MQIKFYLFILNYSDGSSDRPSFVSHQRVGALYPRQTFTILYYVCELVLLVSLVFI